MTTGSGSVITDVIHHRLIHMKFSILSVILVTTVCVMGIKIYQDHSQIARLQEMAVKNEQSGGTFQIVDSGQFHLRRLHCAIPNTIKFRLYVPPESDTYLYAGVFYGGKDSEGYMATQAVSVRPGESIISIYSGNDFVDKHVRTLNANIEGPSSGTDLSLRLEHFTVYEELNTTVNSWFKAVPGSFHGPLEVFTFDDPKSTKALLHLPDGIENKCATVQSDPAGVALWIGPKPTTGQIDSRFHNLETTDRK